METNQENSSEGRTGTEPNTPDYVAKTYRTTMHESGLKTHKDRIGVAWRNSADDTIRFKPNGVQIIDDYVYFFPYDSEPT